MSIALRAGSAARRDRSAGSLYGLGAVSAAFRTGSALLTLRLLFTASPAHAQSGPRLEPLPIAKALTELDFRLEIRAQNIIYSACGIALFDADDAQMVCIDPTSGAVRRAGHKGEGPGEFQHIRNMVAAPDGGIWVADWGNLRLTHIGPDWKIGSMLPLTKSPDRLFMATADSVLTLGGPKSLLLVATSLRDGGSSIRFSPMALDSTGIFQSTDPSQTQQSAFWLLPRKSGGWIVASPWHEQLFAVNDRGVKQASFGRKIPDEMLSSRELASYRSLFIKMNAQAAPADVDRFMLRFAKTPKPAIATTPAEDAQGRLWVPTGRIRADSTELDVFDPRGTFLGTRRMPGEVMGLAVRGDEIAALVKCIGGERDGADAVVRYRVH